jgi:16S rRNA (cytosine1402-N4)-methyltransferase
MQIDQAERGFSFQKTGPLDMRMSSEGLRAYDLVNYSSQDEIGEVIWRYGDEAKAKAIAKAICHARAIAPIESTMQLAEVVRSIFKGKRGKIDSATKTFQAIRIWVNKELENLEKLLNCSKDLLNEGGRLIVISFHSLEDSLVKKFLQREGKVKPTASRYAPSVHEEHPMAFKIITKKPIMPSEQELKANVRSRSAKLRAAIRINKQRAHHE